jgi:hypothetical protein
MHIERSVEISAPADVVWGVMADVERWHTWTASITSIEVTSGSTSDGLRVGAVAEVRQPGFPAATWTVTEWDAGRSFTWEAPAPGIRSVGVHSVEPTGERTCRADLAIHQTGPLAWLIGLLTGRRSRRYVDMEAAGLKARAEELAAGPPPD